MKEYKNDKIIVHWFPELCSHPGICLRALPEVFNIHKRPWINVDAAEPEEIMRAIDLCPSGALKYSFPEGSAVKANVELRAGYLNQKLDLHAVKIKATANGPLLVEGSTVVVDTDGNTLAEGSKMVLCGCGCSCNKPFCDGAHNKRG